MTCSKSLFSKGFFEGDDGQDGPESVALIPTVLESEEERREVQRLERRQQRRWASEID